jgi:ribosomal protein L34
MQQYQPRITVRRVKGGFRQLVTTELGDEQLCRTCGEAWPTDAEFFVVTATSLSYECKACTAERRTCGRVNPPSAYYRAMSEQLSALCFVFFW